jgi:excisionase family DNA binding protein
MEVSVSETLELENTLTYEEAARALGIVPSSVYQLVSEKKLHPIKTPGTNKKRIRRAEIEQYRSKNALSIAPARPVPGFYDMASAPAISVGELMGAINAGYTAISHDHTAISEQYMQSIAPIVNHVISAPERAFLDEIGRVMSTIMNNVILLIKSDDRDNLTPASFVARLMAGIDLPDYLVEQMVQTMANLIASEQEAQAQAGREHAA